MFKISEYLDKTYVLIMKNFIRFGILLLIVGSCLLISGIIISFNKYDTSSSYLALVLSGGFLFLSGTLFIIASTYTRN